MARVVTRLLLLGALIAALAPTAALADLEDDCPPGGLPPYAEPGGAAALDVGDDCEGADQVSVTTLCSTIIIEGTDWDPGTPVMIDHDFSDPDCPGVGDPPDVDGEVPPDDSQAVSRSALPAGVGVLDGVTVIPVDESGSFSAALVVPSNLVGDRFDFLISGVDERGEARREARSFQLRDLASFSAAEEEPRSTAMANVALVLLAVIILGLLANQFRLRRSR